MYHNAIALLRKARGGRGSCRAGLGAVIGSAGASPSRDLRRGRARLHVETIGTFAKTIARRRAAGGDDAILWPRSAARRGGLRTRLWALAVLHSYRNASHFHSVSG